MKKRSLSEEMTRGKAPKGKEPPGPRGGYTTPKGKRFDISADYKTQLGRPTPKNTLKLGKAGSYALDRLSPITRAANAARKAFNAKKEYSE